MIPIKDLKKDPYRLCLFPAGAQAMNVENASAGEVLAFVNQCLRREEALDEETRFQIKALPAQEPADSKVPKGPGEQKLTLSCRGPIRYLELLHLYGIGYQRQFEWATPGVLRETKRP